MRVNFVLSEVATGLRRNLTMTVAMILTTAISLGLMGTGLLIAGMIQEMKQIYYDKVQVSIFLADGVTDQQRQAIATRLKSSPPGRAFALVGPHPVPALALGHAVPSLRVRLTEARGGQLRVRVTNASSIPQPQLPVYAVAARGGERRMVVGVDARVELADRDVRPADGHSERGVRRRPGRDARAGARRHRRVGIDKAHPGHAAQLVGL